MKAKTCLIKTEIKQFEALQVTLKAVKEHARRKAQGQGRPMLRNPLKYAMMLKKQKKERRT